MAFNPHDVASRSAARTMAGTWTTLGATPPSPVAKALTRWEGTVTAFRSRPAVGGPDALPLAVLAALEGKRDPATCPEVQRIITAQELASRHQLGDQVEAVVLDLLRQTVRDNADNIVETWRPSFTRAAVDVAEAHALLDGIELDDVDSIVRRGGAAAEAWGKARSAIDTLKVCTDGHRSLSTFTGGAPPDRRYRLLALAEVPADQWISDNLDRAEPDPWAAVGAGHRLRLPSLDEYAAAAAAIEGEIQHRTDTAAQRRAVAV